MERDFKFEVQFLISLTLVVFGILSNPELSESIDSWIGISVVLLLGLYFSVFIIIYGYGRTLPIKIDLIHTMEQSSKPILLVITTAFTYFVLHAAFAILYDNWPMDFGFTFSIRPSIITHIAPIIPIGIVVIAVTAFVIMPLKKYSDLNIKVIPNSLRVFPEHDERATFTTKIENLGVNELDWQLSIDIPEDTILEVDGESFSDDFVREGNLNPNRAFRQDFEVFHTSSERTNREIVVSIILPDGSMSETIHANLIA